MEPLRRCAAALTRHWADPTPSALSRLLQPLSWLYAVIEWLRRRLYALGWIAVERSPIPVLVVGNLVAGGAGKTPVVIALVHSLRLQGWTPGIVARGYGRRGKAPAVAGPSATAQDIGDEPLLAHRRTGAPVAVGSKRPAAAALLCQQHPEVDILVSDDGLQHLAWHRDVQVIVFDARGAGNGLMLPAGPLRGPLPAVPGDTTLVIYNSARASTQLPGYLGRRRLAGVRPLADWWRGGPLQPLACLHGRALTAAAGLAQPEPFFAMLREQGLSITTLPLPDHFAFESLPWLDSLRDMLVTEKDAVKLLPGRKGCERVWVVTLDFEPEPGFIDAVLRLLPTKAPR